MKLKLIDKIWIIVLGAFLLAMTLQALPVLRLPSIGGIIITIVVYVLLNGFAFVRRIVVKLDKWSRS